MLVKKICGPLILNYNKDCIYIYSYLYSKNARKPQNSENDVNITNKKKRVV